jgi:hypothetical protein
MKDYITSSPLELKGFYTMAAGTIVQLLSSTHVLQLMGFLVAVAGLIVQISAYLKNRAETKNAQAEEARAAEKHALEMKILHDQADRHE